LYNDGLWELISPWVEEIFRVDDRAYGRADI
jgi:hypothetical protein